MVPKEWTLETLGSITAESAFGPRFSSDLYDDNGTVGTIRTTDLDEEGNINYSTIPYAYLPKSFESHYLREHDLLITRSGSCGIPCLFENQTKPIIAGAFLIRFRLNNKAEPRFIHALLKSEKLQNKIQSMTAGGVQKNLSGTNLKKLEFFLPPLSEQKKIAQILSTWDKAITTTEKLLANSEQQKKALMQQLLTGKKRFLSFCDEWKQIRLKSVLKEEKARNRDNSIQQVLSITNHSGFVLPEEQFSKRIASDNISNYKIVRNGQFGYNPSRLNVGSFARLDKLNIGVLSPMYIVFSVKSDSLDSDYFLCWMQSNEAKQRVSNNTQGSVRDSVGFDALCRLPFKLPPMIEQKKIASMIAVANQEIEKIKQKLVYFRQEKKALMQQLLTGKRRVKL
ncbi:restriction endonuclease subunit S [Legionella pneumophila]|uniref:restriction endonuclease subunit S n=1 Tax=Legionella pneumophila TaxID=446 RepID=UPI000517FE06|nr:restriction endonuclease subunit S [Legionella pneumophila]MDW9167074.1 restriction endonuclease subunit S [Legionella pneumophila subsp. fraseri]MDX1845564.1 restriction endonuclease subunit S [Legionella pneumophila subsp. fraseri]VEB32164.1 EcoKI restriction-modification system protein HsdS [Legionella pneumophila]HAT1771515.1 restriction endonuclease subunit S [Legionella pneumophila]HAT1940442.1 restriction endonuclease subunit S [Legionella pneumophila]